MQTVPLLANVARHDDGGCRVPRTLTQTGRGRSADGNSKLNQTARNRRGTAVRIAPSLLAADFANLSACIKPLRPLQLSWLHLDIMDGHFVPNISFGPGIVQQVRKLDRTMFFDCHLMVERPRDFVKEFIEAGANHITFHVEAAGDDSELLLKYLRRLRIGAGISIKPRTPVDEIHDVLQWADIVLVMTVEPGFGGQKLIPSTLNKVRQLALLREELGLEYLIQVDGGIDPQTAPLAVAAGADVLVAGTSVFRGGNIRQNTRNLRNSMVDIA